MGFLISLIVGGLFLAVAYAFINHRRYQARRHGNGCEPPRRYPHQDPLFGIDLFVDTGKMYEEHRFLPTWYQRYADNGSTFEVSTLGTPTICSCEPANLQSVFSTNAKAWGVAYRLPALGPYCGRGFLTTDGLEWEHSRALLAPSFLKANISDHTDFAHYLDLMIGRIPRDGAAVDLQMLLFSLYLDTATLWLFGESFESLSGAGADKAEAFIHSFAYSLGVGGFRMALGPLQFLHYSSKWRESNRANQAFIEKYVDLAVARHHNSATTQEKAGAAGAKKRPALLDAMAEQSSDKETLRNAACQAFIAAHETTACLISNLFWILARHPEMWVKLRTEALTLGDGPIDFERPMTLKYLRSVINESE